MAIVNIDVAPVATVLQIGISKTADVPILLSDGIYKVTYRFSIQNMGNVPLDRTDVIDDLGATFPAPVTFSVQSIVATGSLAANTSYNGGSINGLLVKNSSTLAPSQIESITLVLNVNTNGETNTYFNSATAYGNQVGSGNLSKDRSNNGHIDSNLNGNPSDQGEDESTPVTLTGTAQALIIPDGFTPDGDGQNDNFVIQGISLYPDNKLIVYNRWGNIIYQQQNYANNWNGVPNYKSSNSDKVAQGTYYYILELNKDDEKPRKGYIVIEY